MNVEEFMKVYESLKQKATKPKLTGIDRRFQEDMIDAEFSEMDMMDEW